LDESTALDGVRIPFHAKRGILLELDALGISHMSLFPDLDGVATQVAFDIFRSRRWLDTQEWDPVDQPLLV
jgi:hypothetical protein